MKTRSMNSSEHGLLESAGIELSESNLSQHDYGSLHSNRGKDEIDIANKKKQDNWILLILNLFICIVTGPINFILYKILYTAYGQSGSFFVNTGVNVIYCIYGAIALLYVWNRGEITPPMLKISHTRFATMGALDTLAGFLSAMGAYGTSGPAQQLLNQTLIPFTMLLSYAFLGHKSSAMQIAGSVIIIIGSAVVLSPSLLAPPSESAELSLASALIYMTSNLPYAASYCYKEFGFKDLHIHVIFLTQWVSIYQLLLGLLLIPMQQLPYMGSDEGMDLDEALERFSSGWSCFMQRTQSCADHGAFWLLVGYCGVNFLFNTSGLYLVKCGSAVLNAIVAALILPLTVLAFSLPVLGVFSESLQYTVWLGLLVVLAGFVLWKVGEVVEGQTHREIHTHADAFQERVVVLSHLTV